MLDLAQLLRILGGNHMLLNRALHLLLLLLLLVHLQDDTVLLLPLPLDLELATPHVDRVGREHTAVTTTSTTSMAIGIATDRAVGGEAVGSATNLVVAMAAAAAEEAGRQSRTAQRQSAASASTTGPPALLFADTVVE